MLVKLKKKIGSDGKEKIIFKLINDTPEKYDKSFDPPVINYCVENYTEEAHRKLEANIIDLENELELKKQIRDGLRERLLSSEQYK